ncbi:MAG: hypothetical protein LBQ65_08945 [Tannerellaceae bacterium]|jgi:hypothetical protein|nr:hypothetical protein [Tannerellaceae bacterium]
MMRTIKITICLLCCLCLLSKLPAQVTIGIAESPAEGALLQLKDLVNATKPGGENAKKGLLIPRVELVNHLKLDPMFPDASEAKKKEHAGLIVYNLTQKDDLKEGIMVWNGEMWNLIKSKGIDNPYDSGIKKTLYRSVGAKEENSVLFGSVELTLHKETDASTSYYAHPHFKTEKPERERKFHYQIGQYWHKNGYSYDVDVKSFTPDKHAYQHLANGSHMAPNERNEIWMFEDNSDDILHIQFITLGEETTTASNIFAVLVERF